MSAISVLSTLCKMAKQAVADYLLLVGSKEHRSTDDSVHLGLRGRTWMPLPTLSEMWQQSGIYRHNALLMTDVAADFHSTRNGMHPTILKWINLWPTGR
jgi:hypothetical protein